jgi:O-antigen ligase
MSSRAGKARSGRSNPAVGVALLERILFLVLLAVLCARPLISESFERAELSFLPVDTEIGATPATTIWLDSILLAAAALVWIRRRPAGPRAGVVSIGLGLLAAAVVVSVVAAHDKRLAANAGAHLFVMALAATALVRVMRARWMVHVLIAALLAGGVTNAVKCISQSTYEFDELRQYWEEQKPALTQRGVDVDTPALVNYERRLRSAEAYGHLYHPNVTASCMTMGLLVAAGLFIGVLRKPRLHASERAAVALIGGVRAGLLCAGLVLTGSVGGAAAAGAAGLLLLVLGAAHGWAGAHVRSVFALLVVAYVAVIAAGAGYGLLKGTLPHTSLAFRWQYWQAAARTVADAPLTGVGRENFRAAYLLHKTPESTEEVSNPHDLWLSLLVELGPLGLIAGILLIGTVVHAALRNLSKAERPPPAPAGYGILIAAAAAVLLTHAVFSGEQFSEPGIPLLWAVFVAGVWIVGFVVGYSLILQVDEHPAAAVWLAAGLIAALCAALIHNLIGFSLFTPAGMSTFVVLAAAAFRLSADEPADVTTETDRSGRKRRGGGAVPVGFAALLAAYGWFVAIPTIRVEAAWQQVSRDLRAAPSHVRALNVLERGRADLDLDPWDVDVPLALAKMTLSTATQTEVPTEMRGEWIALAHRYAESAVSRNPQSFAAEALLARVMQKESDLTGTPDLLARAAAQWDSVVTLYPTNPRTRIAAGQASYNAWEATGWPDHAYRALRHLCAALAIDRTRKPEVAVKLRPAELQAVYELLSRLESAGFGSCEAGRSESQSPH